MHINYFFFFFNPLLILTVNTVADIRFHHKVNLTAVLDLEIIHFTSG